MTSPLFWKSWEINSLFFKTFLNFQNLINVDKGNHGFTVRKNKLKLIPFYISLFVIFLLFICYVDLFVEIQILGIIKISIYKLMIYTMIVPSMCLGVLMLIAVWPFDEFCEFLNRLVKFEANLPNYRSQKPKPVEFSTLEYIKNGKTELYSIYIRKHHF